MAGSTGSGSRASQSGTPAKGLAATQAKIDAAAQQAPPAPNDAGNPAPPPPPEAGALPPPPPPDGAVFYGPLPPPPPPGGIRIVAPHNRYEMLARMSRSNNKRFGGTIGDASAFNWLLSILRIAASICVIVWSQSFSAAFGENGPPGQRNFAVGYYMAQYAMGLAVVTLLATLLYAGWTWADSRHAMRLAHQRGVEEGAQNLNLHTSNVKGLMYPGGKSVRYPGMFTSKYYNINRLTVSRLFAERRHIEKLRWAYLIFTVLWTLPFLLLTFKDGYVYWRRVPGQHDVKIAQICPDEAAKAVCLELAKCGISTGVLATLFLLSLAACIIALMTKKGL